MTPLARLQSLLKRGYFPEGLPPPFKTDTFSKNAGMLTKLWGESRSLQETRYQRYSIPKAGGHRRLYAITNPISQFYLSRFISNNWDGIQEYTDKSVFALDKIKFQQDTGRSVTLTDFAALKIKKLKIASRNTAILQLDISRFYPTLYTHSIPWALHGKEWCKKNYKLSSYKDTLGFKLDRLVRFTQENQTLGIPIGPDTSRILSEILAVAAELKFLEIYQDSTIDGVRNYDDIFLGAPDASVAEKYKSAFSQALNYYELELNQDKTRITDSGQPLEKVWS